MKQENLKLRRSFVLALLVLLIAFAVASVATFAWYIYTINAHTTNVHMAAGAGVNLQISSEENGNYGSAAVLEAFVGVLNPVSTDRIQGGFQKVAGFTRGKENQPMLIANLFKAGEDSDYYKTALFLRTNGPESSVYVSSINYEDSDENAPISTAIRLGLVIPSTGQEYIFEINRDKNPEMEYNTFSGEEGHVLDHRYTDGTTLPFTPLSSENFCIFDSLSNTATLKEDSVSICMLAGGADHSYGEPVEVDVYIWLEGCDEDCTKNLMNQTLSNIAISFSAVD